MGYITNFIVYTLAMVGVIVVALLIFKNATCVSGGKNSKYLKIIDSISLGQRKNLYIVSTGKEQFLIAGDVNNTSLISKLEGLSDICIEKKEQGLLDCIKPSADSFKETLGMTKKQSYMDKTTNIGIHSSLLSGKSNKNNTVIRNIADVLKN